jgi:hypothetical protein
LIQNADWGRQRTDIREQMSAPPPAKKTAGLIEKETDERRTSNIERPTSNNEFCPSRASWSNDQFY